MKNEITKVHAIWHNDPVQFARLLTELVANNDDLHVHRVAYSMDLSVREVDSIFDRASSAFEYSKKEGGFKVGNLHVESESDFGSASFVSAERKKAYKSDKVFINDFCSGTEEKSTDSNSEILSYKTAGFLLASRNPSFVLSEAKLKTKASTLPSGSVLLETLQSAIFVGYSQIHKNLTPEFSVHGVSFVLFKKEDSIEIDFSVLFDSDFVTSYPTPLKQVLLAAFEDAELTLDTDMESSFCLDFIAGLSVD